MTFLFSAIFCGMWQHTEGERNMNSMQTICVSVFIQHYERIRACITLPIWIIVCINGWRDAVNSTLWASAAPSLSLRRSSDCYLTFTAPPSSLWDLTQSTQSFWEQLVSLFLSSFPFFFLPQEKEEWRGCPKCSLSIDQKNCYKPVQDVDGCVWQW